MVELFVGKLSKYLCRDSATDSRSIRPRTNGRVGRALATENIYQKWPKCSVFAVCRRCVLSFMRITICNEKYIHTHISLCVCVCVFKQGHQDQFSEIGNREKKHKEMATQYQNNNRVTQINCRAAAKMKDFHRNMKNGQLPEVLEGVLAAVPPPSHHRGDHRGKRTMLKR